MIAPWRPRHPQYLCLALLACLLLGCQDQPGWQDKFRFDQSGDLLAQLQRHPQLALQHDTQGWTAIHAAAQGTLPGRVEVIQKLVALGAEPQARDIDGNSPLVTAERPDVVAFLAQSADQDSKDRALVHNEVQRAQDWMIRGGWVFAYTSRADGLYDRVAILRQAGAGADPHSPIWQTPHSRKIDRLLPQSYSHPSPPTPQIKTLVWASPDGPRLVAISRNAPWRLVVLDHDLHVVRVGMARAMPGEVPVALAEFRSQSERAPLPLRGQWVLALADVRMPPRDVGFSSVLYGEFPPKPPVPEASIDLHPRTWTSGVSNGPGDNFHLSPIRWLGEPLDFADMYFRVDELGPIEIRHAEIDCPFAQPAAK